LVEDLFKVLEVVSEDDKWSGYTCNMCKLSQQKERLYENYFKCSMERLIADSDRIT